MANLNAFEDFFRRADLDKDGRISGAEAVGFFQGANLPQVTLAKIWQIADQGQNGFLSKPQFFNALKLVTVAQSGRDLTPEIVRTALTGPVAAQIPPPRIVTPGPPPSSYGAPSVSPQVQTGFSNQFASSTAAPQSRWSSQPSALPGNAPIAPPVIPRPGSASGQRPSTGFGQDAWPSVKSTGPSPSVHGPSQAPASAAASVPGFQGGKSFAASSQGKIKEDAFGGLGLETGKFWAEDGYGGDGAFRAEPVATKALAPIGIPSRNGSKESQTAFATTRPSVTPLPAASGPGFTAPSASLGMGGPWPRMTESDAQRYTRVFAEVDTDRDGKITGEQARDLFLSWGLPREVLKQVWDLSDQDGDSMLSLREFCTALYLMERFREGRPLPPVLPTGFHFDDRQSEIWPSAVASQTEQGRMPVSQHSAGYNVPGWQQNPGALHPPGSGSIGLPRQYMSTGSIPSQVPSARGIDLDAGQPVVYKSKAPVLDMHLVNQLNRDEQNTLKAKHKDAEEADKKAYQLDKEIMDYREKTEYYRSKLQEIILFKSRCDNKLSEITERAAADKREMESLAKKYDERFKAAGEVNSRLMAEEAVFRDIQEKKVELYNAIAKMEQGGDANGLLQSKADRISSDLVELRKAFNERGRRLGLHVKAISPSEQQFGWQPGLQENAAEWDEDWDKFDDEGFVSVQDFMGDGTGGPFTVATPLTAAGLNSSSQLENEADFGSSPRSEHKVAVQSEDVSAPEPVPFEHTSPRAESETSGRSGVESPTTSSSQAVEKSSFDKSGTANKASQRYANLADSQDLGAGDVFNGPTSYSSTTNSFEQGPPSYDSNDAFGEGGVSWSAAFSHDEEVDSGIRASWGLQSNPSSTQASLDVTGNRTSRFGRTGLSSSHGFGDSLDFGSLEVSSPGRVLDGLSSPGQSHRGNGAFRESEDYDAFGSLGSKDFDRSPSFFGGSNTMRGNSGFDSPRSGFGSPRGKAGSGSDRHFARFDTFSPQNNPVMPGGTFGEEQQENNHAGAGNNRGFARFDSISSVKSEADRGRGGLFSSFDEGDNLFAGTGPFGAAGHEKKPTDYGWSAF